MKEYWKAWLRPAVMRALHTVAQTLAATLPAGLVITVEQIRDADWGNFGLSILAWLGTGLLAGLVSLLKSAAVGMPELPKEETDD